jgi:hypothetical protein
MSAAAPGEDSRAAGPSGGESAGAGSGHRAPLDLPHGGAPEPAAQAGAGGSRGAAADLKG